jgi:hypothetical protein
MERRRFSREFKLEAVRLVRERGHTDFSDFLEQCLNLARHLRVGEVGHLIPRVSSAVSSIRPEVECNSETLGPRYATSGAFLVLVEPKRGARMQALLPRSFQANHTGGVQVRRQPL